MPQVETPLSAEERAVIEGAPLAKQLLEHPAWQTFTDVVARQIAAFESSVRNAALAPTFDLDAMQSDVLRRNWQLGTINGLRLALDAPSATVAAADEIRQRIRSEEEETD